MSALSWLTARPVAHRGLHDAGTGIVENTPSAVDAALQAGFAIEVDLQLSADGVPMVFHDSTLDRLTTGTGPVSARTADELQALPFKATADRIMRLDDLLARVNGRVPLIIELKSEREPNTTLATLAAARIAAYGGHAALMSFDPRLLPTVRAHAPEVPRGIVAELDFSGDDWPGLNPFQRMLLGHLLHWPASRFQFVAFRVADLDALAPRIARWCGLPVLTWTVRTPDERKRAARYADQIIFEGFRP
ncbi:glycerophosphodiester phosphodiesterase family protein [Xanthobacter agilis]|uniref:Glycerophosphoryl diester phosphodiesterase n=1 Tax=Xanthobacter agilis TaxID=47492 RepID=A0ABU0LIF3_XANAG|nr:glycerophosphodiester phosphodiesterase family protein [Xanthobacter agilis]MDQ0506920.1 glycerophosphoryl diester phosphodiesterase [Xanthobacter agilis]